MLRQSFVLGLLASAIAAGPTASLADTSLSTAVDPNHAIYSSPTPAPLLAVAPTGETYRYVIPHFYSVTSVGSRSLTGISIRNGSKVSCSATVTFQSAVGSASLCVLTEAIPSGESRIFCSQNAAPGVFACTSACAPPLNFNAGHALISTTSSGACALIQVDAQVLYSSAADPDTLIGVSQLSVTTMKKTIGD